MGEEQVLGVTKVVNALLGKPVLALFALLHIQPLNNEYPITNAFAMELLVVVLAMLFFLWLKARDLRGPPGATQQTMEIPDYESDGRRSEGSWKTASNTSRCVT